MKFTVLKGHAYDGPDRTHYFEADKIEDVYKHLITAENIVDVVNDVKFSNNFIEELRKFRSNRGKNYVSPLEKIFKKLAKLEYNKINDAVTKLNIKDQLTDFELKTIFEFCFTPAEGIQEGIPGKEWSYIKVVPYEEPKFVKI